jgi:endoglucanase
VILATLQELEQTGTEANLLALFTRAEEVGFVGAIEVARSGRVPHDVTIISLECSSDKGGMATIGEGAVLRVGDRTSIFDPSTTAMLGELAKRAEIPCTAEADERRDLRSDGVSVVWISLRRALRTHG